MVFINVLSRNRKYSRVSDPGFNELHVLDDFEIPQWFLNASVRIDLASHLRMKGSALDR